MKKDIEWLRGKLEYFHELDTWNWNQCEPNSGEQRHFGGCLVTYEKTLDFLDELDEPEEKEPKEVEEEQKYYVLVRDEEYGGFWFLSKKNNGNISIGINRNYSEIDWDVLKLTEQEIKDYDERFWAFAVLKGECQ